MLLPTVEFFSGLFGDRSLEHGPIGVPSLIILKGVRVGRGAIVAANSVVKDDVLPLSIVAGSPARKVGQRERETL